MKKKLICALLCTIAIANLTACGKKVDMDALKEEMRAEIMEEMEEEQEKEEREAEREARREEREKEDEEKENEEKEDEEDLDIPVIPMGPEESEEPEEPEVPVKTPVAGSTDWQSMTFSLDGKSYTIPFAYSDIKPDWSFDMADYGYEDGYILNPSEYVYSTISLENDAYDCDFNIGIINNTSSAIDITEGDVWAASIDISWGESYPDLVLPGNLTWGSTLEEVEAAFGVPEDTYYSESLGYWEYTYQIDYTYYFDLTIYDDKGITAFGYKQY